MALVNRPAVAVVTVLINLRRGLAIGRIRHHVITVTHRLRRWLHNRRRWFDHDVILGRRLVRVIRPGCEEEQRTAYPHLTRITGDDADANPVGRLHHDVARTFRAIPVAP